MKVENMTSRNGNKIANQFIIRNQETGETVFQSYESVIAKIDGNGKTTLDERFWNYSVTTSKYRGLFLGETTKETEKKIKSGEYTFANLN